MKLILAVQIAALALGSVSARGTSSKQSTLRHLKKELSLVETSTEPRITDPSFIPSSTDFESRVTEHARAIVEPAEIAREVESLSEQYRAQVDNRAQVEEDKAEEIRSLKEAAELKYTTDKNAFDQAEQAIKDAQEELRQAKLDTEHRRQIVADKRNSVMELRRKASDRQREVQAFRAEVQTNQNELNFLRDQFNTRRTQENSARVSLGELEKSIEVVRHERVMRLEEMRRRFQEEEDSRIMTTMRQAETRSAQLRQDMDDVSQRLNKLENSIMEEQQRAIKPLEEEFQRRTTALDSEFTRESGRINGDKDRIKAETAVELKRLQDIADEKAAAVKSADSRIAAIDQQLDMLTGKQAATSAAAAAAAAATAVQSTDGAVQFLEVSQAGGGTELLDDATAIKSLQEERAHLVEKKAADQKIYADTKLLIEEHTRKVDARLRVLDDELRALTSRIVDAKAAASAYLTENKVTLSDKFAKQLQQARAAAQTDLELKQKSVDKIQADLKVDIDRIQKETEPKVQQEGALLIRQNEEDDRKIADARRAVDEARNGLEEVKKKLAKKEKEVQEKEVTLRGMEFDDWNAKIAAREKEALEAQKAVDDALKAESDAQNGIVRATQVSREIEKTLDKDMAAVRTYNTQMKALLRAAKEITRAPVPNFEPEVRARRAEQAKKDLEAKLAEGKLKTEEEARVLALNAEAKLQEMVAKQEEFLAVHPINA